MRVNALGIVFGLLFAGTLIGQAFVGHADFNAGQIAHASDTISLSRYTRSSEFGVDVLENWQSEYLQFSLYILGTVWLIQRGSPDGMALETLEQATAGGRETLPRALLAEHRQRLFADGHRRALRRFFDALAPEHVTESAELSAAAAVVAFDGGTPPEVAVTSTARGGHRLPKASERARRWRPRASPVPGSARTPRALAAADRLVGAEAGAPVRVGAGVAALWADDFARAERELAAGLMQADGSRWVELEALGYHALHDEPGVAAPVGAEAARLSAASGAERTHAAAPAHAGRGAIALFELRLETAREQLEAGRGREPRPAAHARRGPADRTARARARAARGGARRCAARTPICTPGCCSRPAITA